MSETSSEQQQPAAEEFYAKLAEAMVSKVAEAIDYDKLAEALAPKLLAGAGPEAPAAAPAPTPTTTS